jgi:hypothetical protein
LTIGKVAFEPTSHLPLETEYGKWGLEISVLVFFPLEIITPRKGYESEDQGIA